MKSRNVMMLWLAAMSLLPLLLGACAHDLPTPNGNQLSCPALQPVDPLLMQPVSPHFQTDWNNWLNSTQPSSLPLTKTP